MGLRFNKRIKIADGMTLNLNKKSVGVSVGGKGAKYTINSKGKRTSTVGLPGTGLYYSKSSGSKKQNTEQNEYHSTQSEFMQPKQMKMGLIPLLLTIFLGWSGIQWFMVGRIGKGLLYLFTVGLCCVGWFIDIINQVIGFVKLVSQVAKEQQKEGQE
jgi:TM2 domain-containing membrane protein YozV